MPLSYLATLHTASAYAGVVKRCRVHEELSDFREYKEIGVPVALAAHSGTPARSTNLRAMYLEGGKAISSIVVAPSTGRSAVS